MKVRFYSMQQLAVTKVEVDAWYDFNSLEKVRNSFNKRLFAILKQSFLHENVMFFGTIINGLIRVTRFWIMKVKICPKTSKIRDSKSLFITKGILHCFNTFSKSFLSSTKLLCHNKRQLNDEDISVTKRCQKIKLELSISSAQKHIV